MVYLATMELCGTNGRAAGGGPSVQRGTWKHVCSLGLRLGGVYGHVQSRVCEFVSTGECHEFTISWVKCTAVDDVQLSTLHKYLLVFAMRHGDR
jgi:hypothetical protein